MISPSFRSSLGLYVRRPRSGRVAGATLEFLLARGCGGTGRRPGFRCLCSERGVEVRLLSAASSVRRMGEHTFVMTRPIELVDESMRLAAKGLSTSEVARRLGVPRSTVRDWLAGRVSVAWHRGGATCGDCHSVHDFDALHAPYVYLLGMYLGDGCLAAHPRGVYKLLSSDPAWGFAAMDGAGIAAPARATAMGSRRRMVRASLMPASGGTTGQYSSCAVWSARGCQPRRIRRPTAAISSSVRSSFFESGPPTTQW